ncbi:MAG: flagellar hook-basal body complex protein [Solirubrobacteraceae bacterium]
MNAAISGLEAHQTMLDVTANNLANVDTIGYKAQRTTFQDELSQTLSAPTGPNGYNGGQNAKQVGLGVQVGSIDNLMGTGSQQTTGNALDIYIQGDGFLQVGNGAPGTTAPYTSNLPSSVNYTRAGNLTLNSAGFLTSQSGQYIVGATAPSSSSSSTPTYINVPPGSTNIAVGQNGAVSYTDENSSNTTYGQTVTAGYLSLATFPNSAGLERDGGTMWSATASSGPATTGTPNVGGFGQTIAGSLEMSNVDMATEFTNMITAERGYQANSKVTTTADTMLSTAVNMAQG